MTEEKTYKENLQYWLWITKGARFSAQERCLKQHKWSNLSIALLSAYLIIINLISVFKITNCYFFENNLIAFISTALSILVLVFSQLEHSNDLKLKAEMFHNCARDLSVIYRKVKRIDVSTITPDQLKQQLEEYSNNYESLLAKHENHKEIDYNYYRATHPEDFPMSWIKRFLIYSNKYFTTVFIYHLIALAPPAVCIWLLTYCGGS